MKKLIRWSLNHIPRPVLQLDFDVGKRDDGKVHVHAAVAQFDHLGGESRVCRFHIAVAGFVIRRKKSVSASKK